MAYDEKKCDGWVCGTNIKKGSLPADRLEIDSFKELLKEILEEFAKEEWFKELICSLGCQGTACTLKLSTENIEFTSSGGTVTSSVITNNDWEIVTNDKWYTVTPTNGQVSAPLQFSTGTWQGLNPRTGQGYILGCEGKLKVYFTVIQPGVEILTMNPDRVEVSTDGECKTFTVSSNEASMTFTLPSDGHSYIKSTTCDGNKLSYAAGTKQVSVVPKIETVENGLVYDTTIEVCMDENDTTDDREDKLEVSGGGLKDESTLHQPGLEEGSLDVECPVNPSTSEAGTSTIKVVTNQKHVQVSITDCESLDPKLSIDKNKVVIPWEGGKANTVEVKVSASSHVQWGVAEND